MKYLSENDILEIMDAVIKEILIPKFMSLGLNASGNWINQLEPRVQDSTGFIYGVKYTEQLVWGRKPNADQSHEAKARWAYWMSSYNEVFMQWLRIRGLTEYGFQVAYKIADVGTDILQKGGTDLLEVLNAPETIKFISDKVQPIIRENVTLEIRRELQKQF